MPNPTPRRSATRRGFVSRHCSPTIGVTERAKGDNFAGQLRVSAVRSRGGAIDLWPDLCRSTVLKVMRQEPSENVDVPVRGDGDALDLVNMC